MLARGGEEGGTLALAGDDALHLRLIGRSHAHRLVEPPQHTLHHVLRVARHTHHRHARALRLHHHMLQLRQQRVVRRTPVDAPRSVLRRDGFQGIDQQGARGELRAAEEPVVQRHVGVTATLQGEVVAVDEEAGHAKGVQRVEEQSRLAGAHIALDENGAGRLGLSEAGTETNGMDSAALCWEWRYCCW